MLILFISLRIFFTWKNAFFNFLHSNRITQFIIHLWKIHFSLEKLFFKVKKYFIFNLYIWERNLNSNSISFSHTKAYTCKKTSRRVIKILKTSILRNNRVAITSRNLKKCFQLLPYLSCYLHKQWKTKNQ